MPFKLHETIQYNRDEKFLSRSVADSRGFNYLQSAPVSGDAGGIYYIYLESFKFLHPAYGAALSYVIAAIILGLVVIYSRLIRVEATQEALG